jgi:hypothetical protein
VDPKRALFDVLYRLSEEHGIEKVEKVLAAVKALREVYGPKTAGRPASRGRGGWAGRAGAPPVPRPVGRVSTAANAAVPGKPLLTRLFKTKLRAAD